MEEKLQQLISMGFDRQRADQALRANNFNVERACNALIG